MRTIELTQGKVALVDDSDYLAVSLYSWYAVKEGNVWYAARNEGSGRGNQRVVKMHRQIMNLQRGDKTICDHKDHDGLNNQRGNLRLCSHAQNMRNRRSHRRSSSRYLGVCKVSPRRWISQIRVDGKLKYLGRFGCETAAALAYDKQAKVFHGSFANLNFK